MQINDGQVFRGLANAVKYEYDHKYISGHRYVMGLDYPRIDDDGGIVVIDATDKKLVMNKRLSAGDWHLQRSRILNYHGAWMPDVIWAEANSIGAVNTEALQMEGFPVRPFKLTGRSNISLIESLAEIVTGKPRSPV